MSTIDTEVSSLLTDALSLLGRPADAAADAPGRVNLIGEHTDYNDGFVLPLAIGQRTVCALARRDDGIVTVRSTAMEDTATFPVDTQPGDVRGWAAYVAGTIWALRAESLDIEGADLAIASDVWSGAGLSSSAALESAVALALGGDSLPIGAAVDRVGLAAAAQRAENAYVGAPTGIMDQSASLRCRADHLLLLDCRSGEVEHVPVDLTAHGLSLMVVDSRAPHQHAGGEYASRRSDCDTAAEVLGVPSLREATLDMVAAARMDDVVGRRARHVITENDRVLQCVNLLRGGGDPRRIGALLTASHASMRNDFEITVPEVDVIADAAVAAGAHGARMTGGGFGGCVIALVDRDDASAITTAVEAAAAAAGHPTPRTTTVTPQHGATLLSLADGPATIAPITRERP